MLSCVLCKRKLHTCKIIEILARVLGHVKRGQNGGGQDNAFRGKASFLRKDDEALKNPVRDPRKLTFSGTCVGRGYKVVDLMRVVVAVVTRVDVAVEIIVLVTVTVPEVGGLSSSPPPLRPCPNFNLC
jgi:hypothetical protein